MVPGELTRAEGQGGPRGEDPIAIVDRGGESEQVLLVAADAVEEDEDGGVLRLLRGSREGFEGKSVYVHDAMLPSTL